MGLNPILLELTKCRLRWYGHVSRREENNDDEPFVYTPSFIHGEFLFNCWHEPWAYMIHNFISFRFLFLIKDLCRWINVVCNFFSFLKQFILYAIQHLFVIVQFYFLLYNLLSFLSVYYYITFSACCFLLNSYSTK